MEEGGKNGKKVRTSYLNTNKERKKKGMKQGKSEGSLSGQNLFSRQLLVFRDARYKMNNFYVKVVRNSADKRATHRVYTAVRNISGMQQVRKNFGTQQALKNKQTGQRVFFT